MFSWRKLGLVFDLEGIEDMPNWFSSFAQAPNAIVVDGKLRVYFCARPEPDDFGQFVSRVGYVDFDSLDPVKIDSICQEPIIELGDLGEFDEFGTYPFSPQKHDSEFIAIYGGWTRCESVPFNVSLGLAKSKDGEKFEKLGSGPILSANVHEPFVITSPKIRFFNDEWYLTYTAGIKWFVYDGKPEIVYKIRLATSADGIHWNRKNINLLKDVLGDDEAQACPDVYFENNVYHMFFCYRGAVDFRANKENSYRIGYAKSSDGINWERDDSKAGIDISDEGWDSEMVAYPNLVKFQGKTYMLYLGNGVGRQGFGAAVLEGELN
jgi:hypothetical protein